MMQIEATTANRDCDYGGFSEGMDFICFESREGECRMKGSAKRDIKVVFVSDSTD